MRDYAKNLNVFGNNLKLTDYKFADICPDSKRYNTDGYIVLKEMCCNMIEIKTVQYHKLPILMLLHHLYQKEQLRHYIQFVRDFFSEENKEKFVKLMKEQFVRSFQN